VEKRFKQAINEQAGVRNLASYSVKIDEALERAESIYNRSA
jgi:hypothetical protein